MGQEDEPQQTTKTLKHHLECERHQESVMMKNIKNYYL